MEEKNKLTKKQWVKKLINHAEENLIYASKNDAMCLNVDAENPFKVGKPFPTEAREYFLKESYFANLYQYIADPTHVIPTQQEANRLFKIYKTLKNGK